MGTEEEEETKLDNLSPSITFEFDSALLLIV